MVLPAIALFFQMPAGGRDVAAVRTALQSVLGVVLAGRPGASIGGLTLGGAILLWHALSGAAITVFLPRE